MQEVSESFTYTTLFLLRLNLLFGNKREISLIEALEGRRVLEWSIKDESICFEEIDEQEEFMKFLEECSNLVYYKNGSIILNDDINIYDIDETIAFIKPRKYLDYNINTFKYLGINMPIDFITKYYELESMIENLYITNKDGENNTMLDSLYKEKEEILSSVRNTDEDYQDMLVTLQNELYEDLEDDFILFPINPSKYINSNQYDEKTNILGLLSEPYQCAIFTDFPLFRTRVKYDFNSIIDDIAEEELNYTNDYELNATEDYYDANVDSSEIDINEYEDDINYNITNISDEFSDGFGVYSNLSRRQTIFMLEYIKILESMKDRYKNISDELENLIIRLKYMVDNNNIKLYKGNDIDTVINEYKNKDDLDYLRIADEVMYFINEIFNTYYDRFCVRKILFVKAYYNLTNDSEVIDYINEFKDSKLYNHVYKIITGDVNGKRKIK